MFGFIEKNLLQQRRLLVPIHWTQFHWDVFQWIIKNVK